MSTRIYSVKGDGDRIGFFLVEAANKNAAMRHIALRLFDVAVCDQKTLVAAIQDGVPVEVAGAEAATAE